MNDEEVFTRVLAGEPDLHEIVMRGPRSQANWEDISLDDAIIGLNQFN